MNSKFLVKVTEKWPVKVLSVAAALVLSLFHRMNTLETRFFSAPLSVEASEALVPANIYTQAVRIGLRGESNSIHPILEDDIEAYISLKKYSAEGTYKVPVEIRKKGSALGIEPIEISVEPIEISISLEYKTGRNINIAPVFRGTIAQGYELTGQSIIPSSVFVEGPRTIMDMIYELNTEAIDLEGRYENFSTMVNIINNDPLVNVHGNRMIEYRGTIRRISRNTQRPESRVQTEQSGLPEQTGEDGQ